MLNQGVNTRNTNNKEKRTPAVVFQEDPPHHATAETPSCPVHAGFRQESGSHVGRGYLHDVRGRQRQTNPDANAVAEPSQQETLIVPTETRKEPKDSLNNSVP